MAAPIFYVVGQAGLAAARYAAPHVARGAMAAGQVAVNAGKSAFRMIAGRGRSPSPAAAPAAGQATGAAQTVAGAGTVASVVSATRTATTAGMGAVAGNVASSIGSATSRVAGIGLTIAGAVYLLNTAREYLAEQVGGPEDIRRRMAIMAPAQGQGQSTFGPEQERALRGEATSASPLAMGAQVNPNARNGVAFEVVREGRRISLPVPGSENIASPAERLRYAEDWWNKHRADGKIAYDLQPGDRLHMFNGEAGREVYSRGNDGRFGFDRQATQSSMTRDGAMFRTVDSNQAVSLFSDPDAGRSLFGNALSVEPEKLGGGRAAVGSVHGSRVASIQSPDDAREQGLFALSSDGTTAIGRSRSGPGPMGNTVTELDYVKLGREATPGPDGRIQLSDEAQRRASLVGGLTHDQNPLAEMANGRFRNMNITHSRSIDPDDPSKTMYQTNIVSGSRDSLQITARNGELSMQRLDRSGQPISEATTIKDQSIGIDRDGRLSLSPSVRQNMDRGINQMGFAPDIGAARNNIMDLRPEMAVQMPAMGRGMDAGMGR